VFLDSVHRTDVEELSSEEKDLGNEILRWIYDFNLSSALQSRTRCGVMEDVRDSEGETV